MKSLARHQLGALVIGVMLGAILLALRTWVRTYSLPLPDGDAGAWLGLVLNPLNAVVRVVPAFVAGALTSRNSGKVGLAVASLSEIFAFALDPPHLSGISLDASSILSHVGIVLGAALIGCVSGVAGSRTLPSNNSFKPSPLRGLGAGVYD